MNNHLYVRRGEPLCGAILWWMIVGDRNRVTCYKCRTMMHEIKDVENRELVSDWRLKEFTRKDKVRDSAKTDKEEH